MASIGIARTVFPDSVSRQCFSGIILKTPKNLKAIACLCFKKIFWPIFLSFFYRFRRPTFFAFTSIVYLLCWSINSGFKPKNFYGPLLTYKHYKHYKHYKITLIWVPGHQDIEGNCIADELARKATIFDKKASKKLSSRSQQGIAS